MTASPSRRRTSRVLDVLVVDDSALMRRYIRQSLEEAGHRVRVARDGSEALIAVARQKPDVVTLDVEMPKMDGLTCLGHLMSEAPVPVVMVSSLTEIGAKTTFDALELGAVDFVSKPTGGVSHSILKIKELLVSKVENAARVTVRRKVRVPRPAASPSREASSRSFRPVREGVSRPLMGGASEVATRPLRPTREAFSKPLSGGGGRESSSRPLRSCREGLSRPIHAVRESASRPLRSLEEARTAPLSPLSERTTRPLAPPAGAAGRHPGHHPYGAPTRSADLVVVGVSTGGPGTLETILADLPSDFPAPILVAQHMPENFTAIFAGRLGRFCALEVVEVTGVEVLLPGTVYIARGSHDIVVRSSHGRLTAASVASDPRFTWHPSVSRMVASALEVVPAKRLLGIQLTGMGDDGAKEMAEIRSRGGRTIAQSEDSCVVYGMPRALVLRKGATAVLHHEHIGPRLMAWM